MEDIYYQILSFPPGSVLVEVNRDGAVSRIAFLTPQGESSHAGSSAGYCRGQLDAGRTAAACRQLREYFEGRRRVFCLPLELHGTEFQKTVWHELRQIPYGQTRTYGQIAAAIGKPAASRAVGGANHANQIPILIPCHRVIGSDGGLTGFAGGLAIKRFLLELEERRRPGEGA